LYQWQCTVALEHEQRRKEDRMMHAGIAQEVKPEWLRYPEAERYAGLGRSTLWKLVTSGEVQAAKVGKAVRISRRSIDEYMEQQSYASIEE
jgi:excisionase family DNA binding protein